MMEDSAFDSSQHEMAKDCLPSSSHPSRSSSISSNELGPSPPQPITKAKKLTKSSSAPSSSTISSSASHHDIPVSVPSSQMPHPIMPMLAPRMNMDWTSMFDHIVKGEPACTDLQLTVQCATTSTSWQLPVHRAILFARSSFFRNPIHQFESGISSLVVPTPDGKVFFQLLRYMYTDQLDSFHQTGISPWALMQLSHDLGVQGCKEACEMEIGRTISSRTWTDYWTASLVNGADVLAKLCWLFVSQNVLACLQDPKSVQLPAVCFRQMVSMHPIKPSEEIEVINALLRWVSHQRESITSSMTIHAAASAAIISASSAIDMKPSSSPSQVTIKLEEGPSDESAEADEKKQQQPTPIVPSPNDVQTLGEICHTVAFTLNSFSFSCCPSSIIPGLEELDSIVPQHILMRARQCATNDGVKSSASSRRVSSDHAGMGLLEKPSSNNSSGRASPKPSSKDENGSSSSSSKRAATPNPKTIVRRVGTMYMTLLKDQNFSMSTFEDPEVQQSKKSHPLELPSHTSWMLDASDGEQQHHSHSKNSSDHEDSSNTPFAAAAKPPKASAAAKRKSSLVASSTGAAAAQQQQPQASAANPSFKKPSAAERRRSSSSSAAASPAIIVGIDDSPSPLLLGQSHASSILYPEPFPTSSSSSSSSSKRNHSQLSTSSASEQQQHHHSIPSYALPTPFSSPAAGAAQSSSSSSSSASSTPLSSSSLTSQMGHIALLSPAGYSPARSSVPSSSAPSSSKLLSKEGTKAAAALKKKMQQEQQQKQKNKKKAAMADSDTDEESEASLSSSEDRNQEQHHEMSDSSSDSEAEQEESSEDEHKKSKQQKAIIAAQKKRLMQMYEQQQQVMKLRQQHAAFNGMAAATALQQQQQHRVASSVSPPRKAAKIAPSPASSAAPSPYISAAVAPSPKASISLKQHHVKAGSQPKKQDLTKKTSGNGKGEPKKRGRPRKHPIVDPAATGTVTVAAPVLPAAKQQQQPQPQPQQPKSSAAATKHGPPPPLPVSASISPMYKFPPQPSPQYNGSVLAGAPISAASQKNSAAASSSSKLLPQQQIHQQQNQHLYMSPHAFPYHPMSPDGMLHYSSPLQYSQHSHTSAFYRPVGPSSNHSANESVRGKHQQQPQQQQQQQQQHMIPSPSSLFSSSSLVSRESPSDFGAGSPSPRFFQSSSSSTRGTPYMGNHAYYQYKQQQQQQQQQIPQQHQYRGNGDTPLFFPSSLMMSSPSFLRPTPLSTPSSSSSNQSDKTGIDFGSYLIDSEASNGGISSRQQQQHQQRSPISSSTSLSSSGNSSRASAGIGPVGSNNSSPMAMMGMMSNIFSPDLVKASGLMHASSPGSHSIPGGLSDADILGMFSSMAEMDE